MHAAKTVFRVLLSLVVSGVFVVFSLRHTDLRSVVAAIADSDPWPSFAYLGLLLAIHLVRTVRWGLLLEPVGHVGFARLNSASAVGFMLLVTLPLRLGELARPLLISRPVSGDGPRLQRSAALASCVVERIIDGIAIGILGIVALRLLATRGASADFARRASNLVTGGFAALCMALVLAFFMREQAVSLLRRTVSPLSPKLADRGVRMLDGFIRGLHLGSVGRVLAVIALTGAHWALHVLGFWLLAPAFGMQLTVLMACTVLASQIVGVMIPAGPGMLGTSQFFTQAGLSIFIPGALTISSVAARAAAYANTIWMLQFGQQVVLGLVFLLAGHVSLAGLFEPPQEEPSSVGSPR